MNDGILVLNPGSATLKFAHYRAEGVPESEGSVERLGTPGAVLKWRGKRAPEPLPGATPVAAAEAVFDRLASDAVSAVGCRVVMGGERFVEPTPVTPEIIAEIRRLGALAPLHNPVAADVLEVCQRRLPDAPLVAVFDTAFHATLPEVARTYALPHELSARERLRRYGFHGIAHHWVSDRLREHLEDVGHRSERCVTCHLGSGASVCAVRKGRSVDTSMGLTPLEGLVMGTRSGDVDPGLLLYLLNHAGLSAAELEDILNQRSGLLGVSGVSADLRDVQTAADAGDDRAALAIELFAYRVTKTIGAFAAAMGGLDAIAFSGGIGENGADMRARICRPLAFLGVVLDEARNAAGLAGQDEPARVSADGATAAQVWIVPADESRQIDREVRRCQQDRMDG